MSYYTRPEAIEWCKLHNVTFVEPAPTPPPGWKFYQEVEGSTYLLLGGAHPEDHLEDITIEDILID